MNGLVFHSVLQGRERGDSNLVAENCSLVSVPDSGFGAVIIKLNTIDMLGQVGFVLFFTFLLWEAVLCMVGCLTASLAFIH